jgi:DNA-binding NtrC family response regulator
LRKSILLVEDNDELARIFTTFLKNKRLNVNLFSSAEEALRHFRANINLYSIILTDFRMEGMNGIDFAKEVRRLRGNSIAIIMITGYSIYEIVTKEEVAGLVDRIMMKPFSLRSLDAVLTYYVDRFS